MPSGTLHHASCDWLEQVALAHDHKDSPRRPQIARPVRISNCNRIGPPFLESIGKSPEQLAAIEFEVTLPK